MYLDVFECCIRVAENTTKLKTTKVECLTVTYVKCCSLKSLVSKI